MASGKRQKTKAHRLRLRARATVSEVAAAAIAASLGQLRTYTEDALQKQRPEALHQARVNLRKLRIYVRLFRTRIGRTRSVQIREELRWAFRLMGELRDLQVFARDVLPRVAAPVRTTAPFRARIAELTSAASQQLRAPATAARLRALCGALQALEQELSEQRDDVVARSWLAKRLDRQRKRVRLEDGRPRAAQSDLHALRKRVKKLRYTADLRRLLGQGHLMRERRFRAALSALQDSLGALNDARVAQTLITRARAPAALRKPLQEVLTASARAHLVELPNTYACFASARPFWD
jgi:CHAD domain-containing protein